MFPAILTDPTAAVRYCILHAEVVNQLPLNTSVVASGDFKCFFPCKGSHDVRGKRKRGLGGQRADQSLGQVFFTAVGLDGGLQRFTGDFLRLNGTGNPKTENESTKPDPLVFLANILFLNDDGWPTIPAAGRYQRLESQGGDVTVH